jgi:Pentapeptide repeats (9 copies)
MSPQVTAAIIAASVGVLTVIATVAVQVSGRRATSRDTQKALEEQRKQLDRTLAEQRTRTLNERFATAAGQLGSDKPTAVRLAGVYAMAGLADDWEENRQTCVDVLCGYLRLPYEPDPGQDAPGPERLAFRASREVRHTVIRVITAHLRDGAVVSWQGLKLDFTGVVFDGGDFTGARFSGGTVSFNGAEFSGGTVSFGRAEFSGGTVDFRSPGDWSCPPAFPWTGTPPPGVVLPEKEDQSEA